MLDRPERADAGRASVALVDPSLFTLPYDKALAHGLEASGCDVVLYGRRAGADDNDPSGVSLSPVFYPATSGPLAARLPKALRLPLKGLDHLLSVWRFRRRVRRHGVGLAHFQWLPLPLADRWLLRSLRPAMPLVFTVHDTLPFNGNASSSVQQRGFIACLRLFDELIVHTDQGRARLREIGIPDDRVTLLPHGLLDEGAHAAPSGAAVPDDGVLTFLLFGKIKPYKGLDLLIEAFARLPAELRARARVRAIGKPYMPLDPFIQQAAALGVSDRVLIEPRFVGDAEVAALFGPGTVALFPYREIEASGVLSIALAHGRPVIASRLGGFADAIADGRQGLLVPPDDADALSRALARMVAEPDLLARCEAGARDLAASVPSWDSIGRQTVAVYDRARARFAGRGRAG